jgi:hypothetical protein
MDMHVTEERRFLCFHDWQMMMDDDDATALYMSLQVLFPRTVLREESHLISSLF